MREVTNIEFNEFLKKNNLEGQGVSKVISVLPVRSVISYSMDKQEVARMTLPNSYERTYKFFINE